MRSIEVVVSKSKRFPALADNAFLRYFSFAILYFAQGIPNGLMWYSLPAWFAMNGKTPTEIGSYVAVIGLPWSFKVIAAPLMDRFTFLPMGRRKPWILFGQLGLFAGFVLLAILSDPVNQLEWMMAIGFGVSLFSIFQDIGIDSLAIDILPVDQHARANGLMWGSKIFGSAATVASTSWIFSHYGFSCAMIFFGGVIFLIMLVPLILRERAGEKLFPWSLGSAANEVTELQLHDWRLMLKSLFRVFVLPVSLFMGVAACSISIGRGLIDATLPVFTVQKLGWTDAEYSRVFSMTTMVSGLLAMFVGGALIDLIGKIRMMVIFLVTVIMLMITMFLMQAYWSQDWVVVGFFIGFYTIDAFITIGIFAIAMQLAWKRVSASQFTLYMAVSNLGLALGAWVMGQLKTYFDWQAVFLTYVAFAALMLILMYFINFNKHREQVNLLERTF